MLYAKGVLKIIETKFTDCKNRMERESVNYREEILESINDAGSKEIEGVSQAKLIDNEACVYNDSQKRMFLKDIYNSELLSNIIKIILNNRLASYRINFLYGKYKYCFDASYDRTYRHYDLGALSVDLNIRDSFERKMLIHCMGTGAEPYKLKFLKQIVRIYTFLQRGNSLKGLLFYVIKEKGNREIERKFNEELKTNSGKD